jgi:hypothetical protein
LPTCNIMPICFEKDESILADGAGSLKNDRNGKHEIMIRIVITRDDILIMIYRKMKTNP